MKTAGKSNVQEFDPYRVRPLPGQPRKRFRGIPELTESIREVGQTTPGIVNLVEGDDEFDAQLVDGERRLRACKNLGVPFRAEVVEARSEAETFVRSFSANFGKQDHDPLEIAEGLTRMREAGKTIQQLAKIAGKSTCWVSQYMSFLRLHPDVQQLMIPTADDGDEEEDGEQGRPGKSPLSFQMALLLVPLPHARQLALVKKIVKTGMSVKTARRVILRERRDAGESERSLGGSGRNRRELATVERIVRDAADSIGVYCDMPGPELAKLIDAEDATTRRALMQVMGDLAENLIGLSEAIEKRLPTRRRITPPPPPPCLTAIAQRCASEDVKT